jgi:hypothetical protein
MSEVRLRSSVRARLGDNGQQGIGCRAGYGTKAVRKSRAIERQASKETAVTPAPSPRPLTVPNRSETPSVFLGARWLRSPLGDKPTALTDHFGNQGPDLWLGTHVIIKEGGLPPAIEKKGRDGRWTRRRNPRKRCLKVRGRDCGPIAARLSRYRYGLAAPESTADRVILGKRRHLSSRPAKLRDFF